jgi:hypothetical protein
MDLRMMSLSGNHPKAKLDGAIVNVIIIVGVEPSSIRREPHGRNLLARGRSDHRVVSFDGWHPQALRHEGHRQKPSAEEVLRQHNHFGYTNRCFSTWELGLSRVTTPEQLLST